MTSFVICFMLCIGSVSGSRILKVVEYQFQGQPLNASRELREPPTVGKDIPLEELGHKGPTEFSPDQVHISQWDETSMLFSWSTGSGRVGSSIDPPMPYSIDVCGASAVELVRSYGIKTRASDDGTANKKRVDDSNDDRSGSTVRRLTYRYEYGKQNGPIDGHGSVYESPVLHHVVARGMTPGQAYRYRVGSDSCGFSGWFEFTVPSSKYPYSVAVVADLGQTRNSSLAVDRMVAFGPDVVILGGDLSYADAYYANGSYFFWNSDESDYFKSYQPRWDTFGRMMEKLIARVPFHSIAGNHEIEAQAANDNVTNMAYNARYPNPQFPSEVINTEPNDGRLFWDMALLPGTGKFRSANIADTVHTNNTFYSINSGPIHFVFLNNYVPYGSGSVMYRWLEKDLQGVNRTTTPWIVAVFHAPWYSSYMGSYKENAEMQHHVEPLFEHYHVDIVISGHVHAYDRSTPVLRNRPNSCGPLHITIGDGGNSEGLTAGYIDNTEYTYSGIKVSDFCTKPEIFYSTPGYQPTYSGRGHLDKTAPFCYSSQAPWSDFRDPSFGHGQLIVLSESSIEWRWNRNMDPGNTFSDHIIINKNASPSCSEKVVCSKQLGCSPAVHSDAKPWVAPF
eukprot:jgi/Picsp_1/2455/NSC_05916-R1_protein